jgi:hypothetical protein
MLPFSNTIAWKVLLPTFGKCGTLVHWAMNLFGPAKLW